MSEKLKARLEGERDHSQFLEELLAILYGPRWEKLTIYEAKKWRERHLTSQSSRPDNACPNYHENAKNQGWFVCGYCGEKLSGG